MNLPPSAANGLLRSLVILSALLITAPAWGQQAAAVASPPSAAPDSKEKAAPKSGRELAADAGLTKREFKTQKRERQREDMLKRIENRKPGETSTRFTPPPASPTIPNPYQITEDFDRNVNW